jgi:hypothetical protein
MRESRFAVSSSIWAQNLTWMFASRPSARPLSLVGLLEDLLARFRHFGLQNCRSGFRVDRRKAVEIARPNETTSVSFLPSFGIDACHLPRQIDRDFGLGQGMKNRRP